MGAHGVSPCAQPDALDLRCRRRGARRVLEAIQRQHLFSQRRAPEKAWLIRVTINRCRELRRSAWRRRAPPPIPDDPAFTSLEAPEQELFASETWAAVGRLPENLRLIVHPDYYEDTSKTSPACWTASQPPYARACIARANGSNSIWNRRRNVKQSNWDEYRSLMNDVELPDRVHARVMREVRKEHAAETGPKRDRSQGPVERSRASRSRPPWQHSAQWLLPPASHSPAEWSSFPSSYSRSTSCPTSPTRSRSKHAYEGSEGGTQCF